MKNNSLKVEIRKRISAAVALLLSTLCFLPSTFSQARDLRIAIDDLASFATGNPSDSENKPVAVDGYEITAAQPAIHVWHPGGTSSIYRPSTDTDAARGDLLLKVIGTLTTGDWMQLAGDTFDLGTERITIPDGLIGVTGVGMGLTIIKNTLATGHTCVKPGNGTVLANLTVDAQVGPVGFISNLGQTVPATFMCDRVEAKSVTGVDGFHFVAQGNSYDATLLDCVASSTYDALATSGSGTNTILVVNPNFRTVSAAGLSRPVVIGTSGGSTTCEIYGGSLYASSGGVGTLSGAVVSIGATIKLHGVSTTAVGDGSVVDLRGDGLSVLGRSGSGPGGEYTLAPGTVPAFPK